MDLQREIRIALTEKKKQTNKQTNKQKKQLNNSLQTTKLQLMPC